MFRPVGQPGRILENCKEVPIGGGRVQSQTGAERVAERSIAETDLFTLSRAAVSVGIHVDVSQLHPESILSSEQVPNLVDTFISIGRQLGLLIASAKNRQAIEVIDLVREGMPIIIVDGSDKCYLLRSATGRRVDVNLPPRSSIW